MTADADLGATCLILTYDRPELLRQALDAALAQDHEPMEVLVIDNGSGPATTRLLASVDDPRLRVLRMPENVPPSVARNAGLAAATGPWVGFCDDDDLWAPEKARLMVRAAVDEGRRWAYTGCVYVDPQGAVVGGRPAPPASRAAAQLPVAYVVPGGLSGTMWHRDALPDGPVDERMTYCDDWDIALQLLRVGLPAVVDRPLVGFRQHPGAWSRNVGSLFAEYSLIAEKHADLRGGRPVKRWEHPRYVAGQALRAGSRLEAARYYVQAVRWGDWASIPRLLATALPRRVQGWVRAHLLSDGRWMQQGQGWVDRISSGVG